MTTRMRITAMVAIALVAAKADAAPTIVSGSGNMTMDANGAYVLDCPTGCGIDFGTANTARIIISPGSILNSYTGTNAAGGGISLSASSLTRVYSGTSTSGVTTGVIAGDTVSSSGLTYGGSVVTTGKSVADIAGGMFAADNYSIGNVGGTLSITGATISTGTISITSTTGTSELTSLTAGDFTNRSAISLTGTPLTDETRISWNGTTLFTSGTFALVTPTNTSTNSGSASISTYGVADVSYDMTTNSTLISPGDIANAGGSIAIGNGIFLSTTAQGTVVATLGPNGPALPTANIAANPTTFSSWLNDNALVTNTQVDSIGTLIRSGLNSVLFGSHHRILLDNGMTDTGNGFWATGDFARHDPNNTDATIGEFGVYKDVTPTLRLGAGVGVNQARQGLPLNGSGKLDSRYLVLEGDYRAIESGWTGSATAYLGSNRSTIARGYMVGIAPNLSTGDANGSSWAIRLRSDWSNVAALQEWNVSPYLAYTHAESSLDGYTETGGALPVAFSAQKQTSDELRVGVTLLSRLSEQTDLRFPLELAHRSNGSTMVSGVAAATPFSFVNAGSTQDWGRAGIELDHRLDNQTILNGAALFASRGGDSSWLATIGLRHAF